jgi:toxin ParE1/3/4
MQIVIERAAQQDLREIGFYLETHGSFALADRFILQAELAFTQIAASPLLGIPWHPITERLQKLRIWPVPGFRKYFVFYVPADDRVAVLRVLHSARNISTILEDDSEE